MVEEVLVGGLVLVIVTIYEPIQLYLYIRKHGYTSIVWNDARFKIVSEPWNLWPGL